MNRDEKIRDIENLYPADSSYTGTREVGRKLLFEAIAQSWRFLPDEILNNYHELCVIEEQRESSR